MSLATVPPGWVLSVLAAKDDIGKLAAAANLSMETIAAGNGVSPPGNGRSRQAWVRDLYAWVLRTGGVRFPVDPTQPNNAEPGKGHAGFVEGQKIFLPAGIRPPAEETFTVKKAGMSAGALAALALAGFVVAKKFRKGKR